MAEKKVSRKKPKKAKGILEELNTKIRNNRKRFSELNKKVSVEMNALSRDAKQARKNKNKLGTLLAESEKLRKQEKKDRRRIIKLENQVKNAVADLNTVKVMQLKDFEELKRKVNEQSDFIAREAERLNEFIDSLKESILKKGSVSKITVSEKNLSGGKDMSNEEIAVKLVNLYFQEVARTGFKKSLTLSEIVSAYQYALGRLEGIEAIPKTPSEKETMVKEEKITREAENLMKDIDKLKASIDTSALKKLPEKKIKGFSHTNTKGVTYYLHKKGKLYYFSKDPMHAVDKPENMTVVENKQTGLPLVKKKK